VAEGQPGLSLAIHGRQLTVLDAGTGPGVLLLAPAEPGVDAWAEQVPALVAAGYRVVVPSLAGQGVEQQVEDVRNVLRTLGVPRVHLVGAGAGGELAWRFANVHAQRVDRVVLVACGAPRTGPFTDLANAVLMVVGAEDPAMDEAAERSAREHVSGPFQYQRVDAAGARVASEQPGRFNELLLAFLAPEARAPRPRTEVRAQVGRRLGPSLARRLRDLGQGQ